MHHVELVPKAFQCSICFDVMIDPLLQSCGHSICADCRDKLLNSNCPECRQLCSVYTPNLVVKQHVWATYPKACRRKQERLNCGWTILEKAAAFPSGTKRKVIEYVDRLHRVWPNKKLAFPAPSHAGIPPLDWNGFISAKLDMSTTNNNLAPTSLDIRLPGNAAHVFKMAMIKNNELFLAFGAPIVCKSRHVEWDEDVDYV